MRQESKRFAGLGAAAVVAVASACSRAPDRAVATDDAGIVAEALQATSHSLSVDARLTEAWGRARGGLRGDARGWVGAFGDAHARWTTRVASDGALTVRRGDDAITLSLASAGATAVAARASHEDGGRVVTSSIFDDTDQLILVDGQRAELFYVARSDASPRAIAIRVVASGAFAKTSARSVLLRRTASGAVEIVDHAGHAQLRIPAPWLVDAHGTRRDASLDIVASDDDARADRLTLRYDATGLVAPIVIDPAVEPATWIEETEAAGAPSPSARFGASAAFDAVRATTVLFGGALVTAPTATTDFSNETWTHTAMGWAKLSPATSPPGRYGAATTFDAHRGVTVLFGGTGATGVLDDAWEFDGTTWKARTDSAPTARTGAAFAFDSARNVAVLFGGLSAAGSPLDELWELSSSGWSNKTPSTLPTSWPKARAHLAMAFDASLGKSLVFGGHGASGDLDDTNAWNGTTWTAITGATTPSARQGAALAYDDVLGRSLLVGGVGITDTTTWALSAGVWTPLTTTGITARNTTALTYEPFASRAFVFGGAAATVLGDTWILPSSECLVGTDCTSGFCADGFCCNTACDGVCDVCNATPRTCTVVEAGTLPSDASCAYTCNGTSASCAIGCATDDDCASETAYCNAGGTCAVRGAQGAACGSADACTTGSCVDGVCCDKPCEGACEVCGTSAGATVDGTCQLAPGGSPGHPACAAYTCDGADPTCAATSCTSDGGCEAGLHCDGTGACVAPKTQGATCDASAGKDCAQVGCAVCATGFCVDGVCCASACEGSCNHCDATGTCNVLPEGSVGEPACVLVLCDGTNASCPSKCTDSAQCPSGSTCRTADGVCVASTATVTCDGDHTLTSSDGTTSDCAPYACLGQACLSQCSSTSDCASDAVCEDATERCEVVTASTNGAGHGGGCAVGASRGASSAGAQCAWLALAVVVAMARRHRAQSKLGR